MIQQILHRLLERRHFWRYVTFSEVAELYASRLLRLFALKFVAVFTSVYLLQLGYDLVFLGIFWAGFYFLKVFFAWPSAKIAARFGPKHGTLYSNIISAVAMVFLPFVPEYGLAALIPWCVMQAFSGSMNDLCYLIDFSKVKHMKHAGKEIGYMQIIEKVSTGISPLIGGVVASLLGPAAAMILSALLFLMSAVPLLQTAEPTRLHQKLKFKGFPWRTTWRSLVAESAVGADVFTTGSAWTLYIVVMLFATDGDEVYAKIGIFSSLTLFFVMAASHVFGRLIDQRQGLLLLRSSVIINSLTHAFRPTVGSVTGVVANIAVNDIATTGYSMAFTRGMFDTADRSGFRIVYLFLIEIAVNFGAGLASLIFALCFSLIGVSHQSFTVFFLLMAAFTLLIGAPRFMLYRK